jgi:hypothetical protein
VTGLPHRRSCVIAQCYGSAGLTSLRALGTAGAYGIAQFHAITAQFLGDFPLNKSESQCTRGRLHVARKDVAFSGVFVRKEGYSETAHALLWPSRGGDDERRTSSRRCLRNTPSVSSRAVELLVLEVPLRRWSGAVRTPSKLEHVTTDGPIVTALHRRAFFARRLGRSRSVSPSRLTAGPIHRLSPTSTRAPAHSDARCGAVDRHDRQSHTRGHR